jgi:hypothetical protein
MADFEYKPGWEKTKDGPKYKGFQKGVSGNPKGRPKKHKELTELARSHAPEALDKIVAIMRQRSSRLSLKAAEIILDRAWGKAPVAVTGEAGEGPIKHAFEVSWKHHDTGGVTLDLAPKEPILLEAEKVPEDG